MKPWREIAIPHEDVLKGTFQQAEFAADLAKVHEGTAPEEYLNPELFFDRTFITEGDPAEHFFNVTAGTAKLFKLLPDGRRQITGFATMGTYWMSTPAWTVK